MRFEGIRDSAVRKWKRVETANGPRFRSALAAHEAALLKNLVRRDDRLARRARIFLAVRRTRGDHRYQDREYRTPARTRRCAGCCRISTSPTTTTRSERRYLRQPQRRAAQSARAGDHRRQTRCGTAVIGHGSGRRRPVRADRGRRERLDRGGQRHSADAGRHARDRAGGPGSPAGRPSAGRRTRRLPMADRPAGIPGPGADGPDDPDGCR